MHKLLSTLAKWPGQRVTKSVLETKGYSLPERYKKIVLANCGSGDEVQLERYWDEVSREYLCSAGLVKSDKRRFGGETSYRSVYLDDIALQNEKGETSTQRMFLNDCMEMFYKKTLTLIQPGLLFAGVVSRELEEAKQDEIQYFRISASEWTGTKKDFSNYLKKIAQERGFAFNKKGWQKVLGNELVFSFFVDAGMRTTWKFHLPIVFEIAHKAAPDLIMQTWQAEWLMPGFSYYRMYQSPESAILGIQAHVDLMHTIGDLIINQS